MRIFSTRPPVCAVTFLGHMTDLFSLPSLPALESLAIWVTLGVECLLPIGLAIPRLWLPAVLLGVGFHCVLALDIIKMFYNFSAVMVALLWVFVPPVSRGSAGAGPINVFAGLYGASRFGLQRGVALFQSVSLPCSGMC